MKRLSLAAGGLAVAASLALASAAPSDDRDDGFLMDAIAAPAKISYAGTVQTVGLGDRQSVASVYRIEHRAPDRTQRFYLSPPSLHGDMVVSHGEDTFFVDVHRHHVVRSENDPSNDQIARDDNVRLMHSNYKTVRLSQESFDGRRVLKVGLVSKLSGHTAMVVRIDAQTKLVLDKEQFSDDGSLAGETRFQEIRYSGNMPDSDFDVPKAYPIVAGANDDGSKDVWATARAAGFDATIPKLFPGGFAPVEGRTIAMGGAKTLQVFYSDGLRTVSLFENRGGAGADLQRFNPQPTSVAGRPARFASRGTTTMLTWANGQMHYALVGDLSLDDLQRIAVTLSP